LSNTYKKEAASDALSPEPSSARPEPSQKEIEEISSIVAKMRLDDFEPRGHSMPIEGEFEPSDDSLDEETRDWLRDATYEETR
jgi:hypothetical protein